MILNTSRPRRNRQNEAIRNLCQENWVNNSDLIAPFFLLEGLNKSVEVSSMPNVFRLSIDNILKEIELFAQKDVKNIIVFPVVPDSYKNSIGSYSYNESNFYLKAISEINKKFPEINIITDVALDPYSSDGHDGIVKDGKILNDETLEVLAKMALAQAQAGAKIIGPSDMMDGRVGYIRQSLDQNGFTDVSIMSYTAKYASAFYGPFRDALDSAPKFGDKLTYQMHPANSKEALLEAKLDTEEGADFLMVKPALAYLDIIKLLNENSNLPIVAYNVSGEYAMVKAAAQKGWIDEKKVRNEMLLSMKRAGAKGIITYFAKDFVLNK